MPPTQQLYLGAIPIGIFSFLHLLFITRYLKKNEITGFIICSIVYPFIPTPRTTFVIRLCISVAILILIISAKKLSSFITTSATRRNNRLHDEKLIKGDYILGTVTSYDTATKSFQILDEKGKHRILRISDVDNIRLSEGDTIKITHLNKAFGKNAYERITVDKQK
ncbi:MAG: hypothetical protein GX786_08105 [Clostridiales bacterium]|nr:hypothetical protein [Clostridiales bacterium]